MKRRDFIKKSLIGLGGLGLAGCAETAKKLGLGTFYGSGTVKLTQLPKKDIVLTADDYSIKDGYIISKNGEKIFDEDGDIKYIFIANNKWFYIVKIPSKNKWILKDFNKNEIKTFNAYDIWLFPNKSEAYIALKFADYDFNIFDNVYKFDGKLTLVNKNLDLTGCALSRGIYAPSLTRGVDARTGYTVDKEKAKRAYDTILSIRSLGSAFDNYIYYLVTAVTNGDSVIGAFNNGRFVNLINEGTLGIYKNIQFLKSGRKVVLKVFDPLKYIYLNELVEVNGIDESFEPIKIIIYHEQIDNEVKEKYTLPQLALYLNATNKLLF